GKGRRLSGRSHVHLRATECSKAARVEQETSHKKCGNGLCTETERQREREKKRVERQKRGPHVAEWHGPLRSGVGSTGFAVSPCSLLVSASHPYPELSSASAPSSDSLSESACGLSL